MILKCLSTSSAGNSFILTNNAGKHLMIEAGLPLDQLKQGIDFDIANWEGLICSHGHTDHSLSVEKIRKMGITTYTPYMDTEHKRLKTQIGDFQIESFPVPHNGVENRGFLIGVDSQQICYITDAEYCPYKLSSKNIDTLIIECNYMAELVRDDLPNLQHKVLGHMELETTIGIIQDNAKSLKNVILVHMGAGSLDRIAAMIRIRKVIPSYINVIWAKAGETYNISKIPF